jgi:putative transposase
VELYEHMGRLKIALESLKKELPDSVKAKRMMIYLDFLHLSVCCPCELPAVNRSTFYYAPATASRGNGPTGLLSPIGVAF